MTSDRKIKSNRTNARRSKGAITFHGRARSAKNAFRHGLSLPVELDPVLSEQVKVLTERIAGADASLERRAFARRIAEADIDVRRVRCAYHKLLSEALKDPYFDSRKALRRKIGWLIELLRPRAPQIPEDILGKVLLSTPTGPFKLADILSENAKQLWAFARYERRALSRRKFAIRAFDAAGRDSLNNA